MALLKKLREKAKGRGIKGKIFNIIVREAQLEELVDIKEKDPGGAKIRWLGAEKEG